MDHIWKTSKRGFLQSHGTPIGMPVIPKYILLRPSLSETLALLRSSELNTLVELRRNYPPSLRACPYSDISPKPAVDINSLTKGEGG